MISEISQKSIVQIARALGPDARPGQRLCTNPWYQREEVWDLKRKRKLIDSVKKGMPFGMVWTWSHTVDGNSVTDIIDGKQRCTTLNAFMNDQFRDDDGLFWSEWSESERVRAENHHVPFQGVTLDDAESESMVVELFRRINTQSKQLSTGQLLKSCENEDTIMFINTVFFEEIDDSGIYANDIRTFRNMWADVFCKTEFKIKQSVSHSELTFLAGLVVPMLTGNNEAITSSFDILLENGLQNTITDENKVEFFEKMNNDDGFLDIISKGYRDNQFKKSSKGFPTFGKITPYIYMVNQSYIERTLPGVEGNSVINCSELIPRLNEFFEKLDEDEDIKTEWENRFRKNRNVYNIYADIEFILETITIE
jgi:hypothetical protein